MHNNILGIIHKISFYSIDHFERIMNQLQFFLRHIRVFRLIFAAICPVNIFNKMIGIRKRLQCAMIGNRNCRMSPFIGLLYDIFHFRYAIHITHLGMAVKLYPFLRPGIHTSRTEITDFLNTNHRSYRQLTVKTVDRGDTF